MENMSAPKISVIIPVYNAGETLEKCLDSIRSQTYKNIEIICVDDESTDDSYISCREFAKKDKRIKCIQKKNGGVASARNEGLKYATGEYVTFVDQDDWIEPEMYEKMSDVAQKENADMVVCNYSKDTEDVIMKMKNIDNIDCIINSRENMIKYSFYREKYRGFAAFVWNKIFRRKVLEDNNITFEEGLKRGDDVLFCIRFFTKIEKAAYVDEHFYHYIQRESSITHTLNADNISRLADILKGYQLAISLLEKEKKYTAVRGYLKCFFVYHASILYELAEKEKLDKEKEEFRGAMNLYINEYKEQNKGQTDRINRIDKLLKGGEEKNKKIALWGCGLILDKYFNEFDGENIILIDKIKFGGVKYGRSIYSPEILKTFKTEEVLIVITISDYTEVLNEISELGRYDAIFLGDYLCIKNKIEKTLGKICEDSVLVLADGKALNLDNGVKKFVKTQNALLKKAGDEVITASVYIHIVGGEIRKSVMVHIDEKYYNIFTISEFIDKFREVKGVIIHSVEIGYETVGNIISNMKIAGNIIYYIHDYMCIGGKYKGCKGFMKEKCKECNEYDKCRKIYEFHFGFFQNAQVKIIAPSDIVKNKVERIYPFAKIIVIGHLSYKIKDIMKSKPIGKIRIAYLGSPAKKKGIDDFIKLAGEFKDKYEFFLLGKGYEKDNKYGIKCVDVEIDKNKGITMVEALKKNEIDIAFLGSKCQETYSYTFYEAFESGLFVITTKESGNICEAVKKNNNGKVFNCIEDISQFLHNCEDYFRKEYHITAIEDVEPDKSFMEYLL